jgi:acyl-CoA dehydrogenase
MNELAQLVDDLGRRSFEARLGHRGFPESFDEVLWRNLEDTGLARLTSSQDAGPADAAIVLSGLARHAAAVPVAETDLLAAWLAGTADVPVPAAGPLTVAIADAVESGGRIRNRAMCHGRSAPSCWRHGHPKHCMSLCSPKRQMSTATTSSASRVGRSRST